MRSARRRPLLIFAAIIAGGLLGAGIREGGTQVIAVACAAFIFALLAALAQQALP